MFEQNRTGTKKRSLAAASNHHWLNEVTSGEQHESFQPDTTWSAANRWTRRYRETFAACLRFNRQTAPSSNQRGLTSPAGASFFLWQFLCLCAPPGHGDTLSACPEWPDSLLRHFVCTLVQRQEVEISCRALSQWTLCARSPTGTSVAPGFSATCWHRWK